MAVAQDNRLWARKMDSIFNLSPRERECLMWLSVGLRAQEVSEKLGTSYRTVEKQIASARKKLGANTNEQAVAKALTLGLISL